MHPLRRSRAGQVTKVQSATYVSADCAERLESWKLLAVQKKFPLREPLLVQGGGRRHYPVSSQSEELGPAHPRLNRCTGLVLHRAAIEHVPPVAPLPNGVQCRSGESRVTGAHDGDLFHSSVFVYHQF